MPEKIVKKEEKEVAKVEPRDDKSTGSSDTGKTVAIAVLATALCCFVITFAVLAATGIIRFGGAESGAPGISTGGGDVVPGNKPEGPQTSSSDDGIVVNPNPRVKVNGVLAEVEDLEFYLPDEFEAGGRNQDGAYTFNLTDDDGWAQVVVYVEDTSLSPESYLLKKSPYLDITDDDYEMNGTEWVEAENASMLAYATELDGKVYAVIYSVKLDSDATSEAMSMIPKTLYMKRIYND